EPKAVPNRQLFAEGLRQRRSTHWDPPVVAAGPLGQPIAGTPHKEIETDRIQVVLEQNESRSITSQVKPLSHLEFHSFDVDREEIVFLHVMLRTQAVQSSHADVNRTLL